MQAHDMTDWAIGDALAHGTTPEDIAHNLHEQMSRTEAIRLVKQLLIDKTEYSADLHESNELVMQQLNKTLTNIAVDVQIAANTYMN